jgi:hypothetical protein
MPRPAFILIWGVSGTGKPQYCTWLALRGYVYLDNDTIAQGVRQGTATPIEQLWMRSRVGQATTKVTCCHGVARATAELGGKMAARAGGGRA